ncbi:MAG: hypothetical protein IT425_04990 [Pirellulales bacterium]|nr:hypothetical protein [Pirellulales bacterium]
MIAAAANSLSLWCGAAASLAGSAATLAWFVFHRHLAAFTHDSPTLLFLDLCRLHEIELKHRRLLKRMASARGIRPADLFVEPAYFSTTDMPPKLAEAASDFQQLRDAIFFAEPQ